MVLDTAALIAILQGEPTAERLLAAVEADQLRLISAATVVETSLVVLGRFGEAGDPQLDRLLRTIGAEIVPGGEEQALLAREAALRFGRGRRPAALNFGECFAYARSVARAESLRAVSHDFSQTDVDRCVW